MTTNNWMFTPLKGPKKQFPWITPPTQDPIEWRKSGTLRYHAPPVEWRDLGDDEELQPGDEWFSQCFQAWRPVRAFAPKTPRMQCRRRIEPWDHRTLITPETRPNYQHLFDALEAGLEVEFLTDTWRPGTNFEFSHPPERYRVKTSNPRSPKS
jgi:hypothetical protein